MVETRPDIAYVALVVNRFAKNPSHFYSKVIRTIFCYLKATRDVGILYIGEQGGDLPIRGYSDSDWAGDYVIRKSTSGFIFMLYSGAVSWCLKHQTTIALSSTEAKYVVLSLTSKEAMWLRLLLKELGLLQSAEQHTEIKVIDESIRASKIKSKFQD